LKPDAGVVVFVVVELDEESMKTHAVWMNPNRLAKRVRISAS
jgi:hypothetical protein